MRAGLLVSGVLGVGTALVFAAAALTAALFPNGTIVRTQWNGGGPCFDCGGWGLPAPVPAPFPMRGGGFVEGGVSVDVQAGVAYLRGEVPDEGWVERFGKAARKVHGITGVKNLLHTPGTPTPTAEPRLRASD